MKKYKFKARLEEGRGGGAFVVFPFDVEKKFGTRGRVPVQATFNGIAYSGSLAKYGLPSHILGVTKAIRTALGKEPGSFVDVVVWKDEAERVVDVPPELNAVLNREHLTDVFARLSYTNRKEFVRWITEAKKEETRTARLQKAASLLKQGKKSPF
jgi:hypothetical protein